MIPIQTEAAFVSGKERNAFDVSDELFSFFFSLYKYYT
jgi:hypothetical protein